MMNKDRIQDHMLFSLQFMQMMEDFQSIDDECPACGNNSRSNLICLRDDCDFMLFVAPGELHPSFFTWVKKKKEEIKKEKKR
jgi:hypothetical protein